MSISYTVAIDHDDDGDFSDIGEVITADIIDLRWELGMANAYDSVASPSSARITLRNHDQTYSPEVTSVLPAKPLRIQSDDGTTIRTHFFGYVSQVEPSAGEQGEQLTVIHAQGIDTWLRETRIRLEAQINVTADTVIDRVLSASGLRRPVLAGYMILDRTGNNLIGTNKLFGDNIARNLETGKSVFAYLGDTWGDGIPAQSAIQQIASSERGRFFINRAGEAVFYNRHHTLQSVTPQATFADDMDGVIYVYGADIVNQVEITVTPRHIGAENTALWTTDTVQHLPPQSTRRIIARFRDDADNPIGALTVIPPVPSMDYNVNSIQDGNGADHTQQIDLVLTDIGASSAIIEIRNPTYSTLYLQSLTLRGTPILQDDRLTLIQADQSSQTDYGLLALRLNLPALTSIDDADQMARYELARRKDPRGTIRDLSTSTRVHPTETLSLTLFDRIHVTESQTGHEADYFIIAESHHVDLGGVRHRVTWRLEPADSDHFFIIGVSHADGSRVLAY